MKRFGASVLLAAVFALVLMLAGGSSNAGTCSSPTPPPRGANTTEQTNPADGGKIWYTNPSGGTAGEVGIKGPHGWLVAKGNAGTTSGSISGYSADGPMINGSLSGSAAGPHLTLCTGSTKVVDV